MMLRINSLVSFARKHKTALIITCSILLICSILLLATTSKHPMHKQLTITEEKSKTTEQLFPIQCIDTMKVSRDRAKEPLTPERKLQIKQQVAEVASLGANCIAIGTPYNDEFIPYLTLWVNEARRNNLRVWFRGNFAEWEGWFDYKKSLSPDDHIKKTVAFIENNSDLFRDGDIFTATPEVENGGPFNPIDSSEKITLLRSFLTKEQDALKKAFRKINKNVTTNFVSMSGGVATSVLDSATINALGNTVTLDHYVKDPEGIDEYVSHFVNKYHSQIVFGEFGAPIPDINGRMDQETQAAFVDQLLSHIYTNKKYISGVNYWTLSESSTSLLTKDNQEKPVTKVLRTYYQPAVIHGVVKNDSDKPLSGIMIRTKDKIEETQTDKNGQFVLVIPAKKTSIQVMESQKYHGYEFSLSPSKATGYDVTLTLTSQNMPVFYKIRSALHLEK